MGFCSYKKIIPVLLIAILLKALQPSIIFASRILWPSEMNLDNDTYTISHLLSTTAVASDSRKGFLFCGDPNEVFTLGAGHVAVNVTLSGKSHLMLQHIRELKDRGVKITLILINDKVPVGVDFRNAPDEMKNPYCYIMDFNASNGEWQKFNFDRIVEDYGQLVDNWIIGNEINSQLYGYYGPATVEEYTKVYCETFKVAYEKIKEVNSEADVYISFDQGWDIPNYYAKDRRYDKRLGKYKYNAKEQIILINQYLDKKIDWGISLHPYAEPVDSAYFWDDKYSGLIRDVDDELQKPYLTTLKNFEIAIEFMRDKKFLRPDETMRNIIISEFGVTSLNGEREQAAALFYMWEKIEKYEEIKLFLYNAQVDLPDGYHFGLTSDKRKRRLAWAVFKDMDRKDENAWCKDLLDSVLYEHGYFDVDGVILSQEQVDELLKNHS